jgi:hypothetical protein
MYRENLYFAKNFPGIIPANLQTNLKIFLGVHHGPRKICKEKNKVNKSHATVP